MWLDPKEFKTPSFIASLEIWINISCTFRLLHLHLCLVQTLEFCCTFSTKGFIFWMWFLQNFNINIETKYFNTMNDLYLNKTCYTLFNYY